MACVERRRIQNQNGNLRVPSPVLQLRREILSALRLNGQFVQPPLLPGSILRLCIQYFLQQTGHPFCERETRPKRSSQCESQISRHPHSNVSLYSVQKFTFHAR